MIRLDQIGLATGRASGRAGTEGMPGMQGCRWSSPAVLLLVTSVHYCIPSELGHVYTLVPLLASTFACPCPRHRGTCRAPLPLIGLALRGLAFFPCGAAPLPGRFPNLSPGKSINISSQRLCFYSLKLVFFCYLFLVAELYPLYKRLNQFYLSSVHIGEGGAAGDPQAGYLECPSRDCSSCGASARAHTATASLGPPVRSKTLA